MMTLATALLLTLAQEAPQPPTPDETFAWLKSLDSKPESAQKQPRFPNLTVDDLKTLKEIKLGGHRASDNKHVFIPAAEFRFLMGLPALEKANLVEIDGLTDEALVFIGRIRGLKLLNLGDAQITNEGLKSLSSLQNLENLDLGWTKDVGDAGVAILIRLHSLKILGLGGTKITDGGMKNVAALYLKELRIPATEITDEGLYLLQASRGLETLQLGKKPKVTPQGIERLKKAIPGCTVKTG